MTTATTAPLQQGHPVPAHGHTRSVALWEWALLGVILLGLAWSLARIVGVGDILGHDEAVYASRARSWLHHTTTSGWSAHRAPGLPVLAVPLMALGAGVDALRLIGVAFALALATGVWALARRVGGPVAAPVAAAGIAFSPPLLDHGARLLTDLPATALVVWLMWVVVREGERPHPFGAGLLWAAPLAAGAVYLRMGAALPLALVAIASAVLWPRQLLAGGRWVLATAGLTLLLLGWHLAGAIEAFGTPWGRLLYVSNLTRAPEPGAALAEYIRTFPGPLAGTVAAAVMGLGLVGVPLLLIARRRWDGRARATVFTVVVGVGHGLAMGFTAAADVRFIFVSLALFSVLGGAVFAGVVGWAPRLVRYGLTAVVVLGFVAWGAVATTSTIVEPRRSIDVRYDAMRAAAAMISAESGTTAADPRSGDPMAAGDAEPGCKVLTSYVPQIEWLTGCSVTAFTSGAAEDIDEGYVLLLRDGKRQPEGAELDALLDDAVELGSWDLHEGRIGAGELYRLQ